MTLPDFHALFLLAITPVVFFLFTRDRIPLAVTAFGLLVALVLTFSLFPYKGLRGSFGPQDVFATFGNEALVAICSLMILGQGLMLTGALEPVARFVSYLWNKSSYLAMLFVLLLCVTVSGLLNDTPIVVLMIPILLSVAQRTGAPSAQMLLPMNYAVLLGGMGTTIGTSTNIMVVSIAAGLGMTAFGIFDFVHVTALVAIPAVLYLWLIAPLLLRGVPAETQTEALRLFDAWLTVPDDSPFVGQTLKQLFERGISRLSLLEVKRGNNAFLARSPMLEIQAGDRFLVRETRDNLTRISKELKLPLHDLDKNDLADHDQVGPAAADLQLAELVVSKDSQLVGSTIGSERLAEETGLIVLGLRPFQSKGATQTGDIGKVVIHGGDVLLVQGTSESLKVARSTGGFLVLDGALLMLATSCIKWNDLGESLSANVILIVAASLALGGALTITGGTEFLATAYLSAVKGLSPEIVLSSLMLLIAILTNFVSNNAAAAIGTPVAFSIATQLGVAPEPFVLAVLFGANFSYITPMAYQTNLMVMGAAGYRFKDFIIVGTPLFLIVWGMYSWLLPIYFPLAG